MNINNVVRVSLVWLLPNVSFGAKNVLLIILDDLRPTIGGYGDANAFTPNIDALMKEGISFSKAYAQQALCAPSRNSFLTSRRPDTLHLYDFHNYWRTFAGNFTTLPQYFKENDYETKSIGKVFHPGKSSNNSDDYPLSWTYKPWHPPTLEYKNSPVCLSRDGWFKNVVCPVRLIEQPGKTLPDIESLVEAKAFLNSRKENDKPFFLAVGFYKPHIPLKFPREFLDYHPLTNISLPKLRQYPPGLPEVAWNPWTDLRERHDISLLNLTFPFQEIPDDWVKLIKQSYYASVTYVDSLVGKLLHHLKYTLLDRNTIVILIGDHGWSLGEHGEWSKYSNFDVSLRVPFIIRAPEITYPFDGKGDINKKDFDGLHCDNIVELVDLFPTIVDLAGLQKIPKCPKKSGKTRLCTEGKSLMPLILDKTRKKTETETDYKAFSQYPRPGLYPTQEPNSDKPKLREIKIMGYSVRTDKYRYTEWIDWDSSTFKGNWSNVYATELYDHSIDPEEDLNIANRPGLEETQKVLKIQLRKAFSTEIEQQTYQHLNRRIKNQLFFSFVADFYNIEDK